MYAKISKVFEIILFLKYFISLLFFLQMTQQHNESKLKKEKKYLQCKRNNHQGQNIIM